MRIIMAIVTSIATSMLGAGLLAPTTASTDITIKAVSQAGTQNATNTEKAESVLSSLEETVTAPEAVPVPSSMYSPPVEARRNDNLNGYEADWRQRFLDAVARNGGPRDEADRIVACETGYQEHYLNGNGRGAIGEVGGAQFYPTTLQSVETWLPSLDAASIMLYTSPEVQGRGLAKMFARGRAREWSCYRRA